LILPSFLRRARLGLQMGELSASSDVVIEWEADGKRLSIREVSTMDEYHAVEQIQVEAWGFDELDVVPMAQLVAVKYAGGPVLGAFDQDGMIGFAYGFPAYEHGCVSIHSHMLAVRPECRNLNAGFLLKLAQRAWVLEHGIAEMTWTFDPLQSLNAHLNFCKLGVISERYLVNFYGEATSSPLHQGIGTDRLWVRWLLDSDRVKNRIGAEQARVLGKVGADRPSDAGGRAEPAVTPEEIGRFSSSPAAPIFVHGSDGWTREMSALPAASLCLIEIPDDISSLKGEQPSEARAWRDAICGAFQTALSSGFVVEDFHRLRTGGASRWFYLLRRKQR
jgi:predicted GNAT superfamily acetyltransferase